MTRRPPHGRGVAWLTSPSFFPDKKSCSGRCSAKGTALPGDCRLAAGSIDKTIVKATYACPSGEVIVELAHPAAAPTDAGRTEKFALRIERGTPPPDLQSALLSRICERETQFRWTVHTGATPTGQPMGVLVLSGVVVLVLLMFAARLLWRRRARTTQG